MGIIAKKSGGKSFTPAPTGSWASICVDVVDLGNVKVEFGGKSKMQHKIRIVWQIDEKMEDGRPFIVQKRYTNSLHDKAALRRDLEAWRGRPFTEDELNGFDVENVIGVPAMLSVIHTARNGELYADVNAVMKMPNKMPFPKADPSYVRVVDRPTESNGTEVVPPAQEDWSAEDYESVPF